MDVDSLAGSASAHFRVVATDGVNAGFGESAAITVPNKPPYVAITDPLDGELFQEGDLAVLQGSATDLEDGQLSGDSLVWSSDKDGELGTGESLRLHIGDADLTPKSMAQLGDTDLDGLPELALTLDGAAVRAALTDPYVQTTINLTGTMNNGAALAADAQIALVAPGDVDCNGSTNGADVLAALSYSTSIGLPDCLFAGDLNCDGTVAPLDVLGILGEIGGVSISAARCQTGTASASTTLKAAESSGDGSGLAGVARALWLLPALALPALVAVRRRK